MSEENNSTPSRMGLGPRRLTSIPRHKVRGIDGGGDRQSAGSVGSSSSRRIAVAVKRDETREETWFVV